MRKLTMSLVVIVIVLAMIGCTGKTGNVGSTGPTGPKGDTGGNYGDIPANAKILINENFDSFAVGTTPTSTAGIWRRASWYPGTEVYNPVTNTTFTTYDKSFMIAYGNSYTQREIVKAPLVDTITNTLSGKIYINFYANKDTVDKKGICFYINQFEKARIDLTNDGKVNVFTSRDNYYTAATFTNGYFNKYLIVINLNTQTFGVFLNDIKIADNIPCYNSVESELNGTPIAEAYSTYTTFFGIMTQWSGYLGTIYIDDVLIYYLP